ncbi:MAG: hypothetical protein ABIF11_09610 [Nitrospirota bacterium]
MDNLRLNKMNIMLNNDKLLLYDIGHEPNNVQKIALKRRLL